MHATTLSHDSSKADSSDTPPINPLDIDIEKTTASISYEEASELEHSTSWFHKCISGHRAWFHLIFWLLFTAFVAAAFALQLPKGYNQENLVLGLIYGAVSLNLILHYVPAIASVISTLCKKLLGMVAVPLKKIPSALLSLAYAGLVLAIIIVVVFSLPQGTGSTRIQRLISLVGFFIFIGIVYIFSKHRYAVCWNTVITCILFQFLLALFVMRASVGQDIFRWATGFVEGYMRNTWYSVQFLTNDAVANSNTFIVITVPVIIFFTATVQLLHYIGALQWVLSRLAAPAIKILSISGAEAVVAIATPFLGMNENVLLIRPFIPSMTKSEFHQVMTSGFATISGSSLYAYVAMGVSGQTLLTSCIMSIPCSIAISKLRYPETETPVTKDGIDMSETDDNDEQIANVLHAAGKGASLGMHIALLVLANLVTLLSLLHAVNAGLTWLGNFLTIQNLTLELITGYLFVPMAWLIGADTADLVPVGQLMALKIWANEYVAYNELTTTYASKLSDRSVLVATYALCGFANLGSVGMFVGVLSTLAPKRSSDISQVAISAVMCGALSTWVSATMAGMLV